MKSITTALLRATDTSLPKADQERAKTSAITLMLDWDVVGFFSRENPDGLRRVVMTSTKSGMCCVCGSSFVAGSSIVWSPGCGAVHVECDEVFGPKAKRAREAEGR